MRMTPASGDDRVRPFLAYLPTAPARILLVDFDGTLAPFDVDRSKVEPYPGVRRALEQIRAGGRTRLAVISGRGVGDLRRVLGIEPPPELWGCHGWEALDQGALRLRTLTEEADRALTRAVLALVSLELGGRIERKHASVAVHLRGLAPAEALRMGDAIRSAWEPITPGPVDLCTFDGGMELLVRGWNKGNAVRSVIDTEPKNAAVAYLGDDRTDEDAFRELQNIEAARGARTLGILVSNDPRATAASARLHPPEEVLDFLHCWGDVVAPEHGS